MANPTTNLGMVLVESENDFYKIATINAAFQVIDTALGAATTAMTTWTPTVVASVGTITTLGTVVAKYKQIGKLVFIRLRIPITTNGTGSGFVRSTLPITPSAVDQALHGAETGLTNKALVGILDAATGFLYIAFYDGTYPGANGRVLTINSWYEAA